MKRVKNFHLLVQPPVGAMGFGMTYESLADRLQQVARLYLEPDGCLVWVSSENPDWKINGQITDDGHQVVVMEIRGRASWDDLQAVLVPLESELHLSSDVCAIYQSLPEGQLWDQAQLRSFFGESPVNGASDAPA